MATNAKPTTDNAGGADVAPPKKSKKLLIIVSVIFVLILGIGLGGVYWLFFTGNPDEEATAHETQKPAAKKKAKESAPVYVALDPFTVNLVPEQTDQFLQLILSVEVEDAATGDRVKMYTPKIRNNVMLLLSSKKASELLTKEGKETLANEIKVLMNEVLNPDHQGNGGPVMDVLFTSFIIQ